MSSKNVKSAFLLQARLPNTPESVVMSSTSQSEIVEHIVLFKVKDDANSGEIVSMVNGLNSLVSIDQVLHLSAGPVRSASASAFTHVLHSRYRSKEDLRAYAAHPDHVLVVQQSTPLWEDIMAVDWIANQIPGTLARPPGSVARITLLKLKENVSDESKSEIMEVINEKLPGVDQITVGENFSPARAKGFSIASIAYFKGLGEMEAHKELANLKNEKVRDYLDATIVVEFVLPSSS